MGNDNGLELLMEEDLLSLAFNAYILIICRNLMMTSSLASIVRLA